MNLEYEVRERKEVDELHTGICAQTGSTQAVSNESGSSISNRLRTVNEKIVRSRGIGDGSRASMYPGRIKPIGFGVSWDPVDGEAMLGNVMGIPAPAWPLRITPEDCRIHAERPEPVVLQEKLLLQEHYEMRMFAQWLIQQQQLQQDFNEVVVSGMTTIRVDGAKSVVFLKELLKPSIPILELTPTNEELKETWLIHSLSYIRGEGAPFIQAIKPFQNIDEAPIVNEQSVEIDEQAGIVDDHDPAAPTDSNNLLEDVDSLFKEVIDVRPDLVGRVSELRTKLVQIITSNPLRATPCDDSLNQNKSNGEPLDCYYQESQQGSLQNLVKAMESELEPDVSCHQAEILDEARFDDAVKDNDEMEHAMDVDNEDGKYCLDDMSIGFEEDKSNGEIKVNLYQEDRNPLCDKIEVVVEENTPVTETSPVIKTIVVDSTLKFDVEEEEKLESIEYDCETIPPFTEHIELWVELLWRFRAPDADWALAGPHFCPAIIGGGMLVYISKAKGRYVPWTNVDKVYFPLNEPELHWALAELHLYTGVIIIYDSMTPRKRNKNAPIVENRKWWIDMRDKMSKQLPLFLDKIRVLKRKGLQLGGV
ncbi:phospholipase-like protein [Tanacetum coccineum]|uniref:Phospholipase-like protein n=1 Tax=Tanacetum coccineum TaxID=301880 RepID=A0ABQ5HMI6_9ASTR